jgi:filamentous hemagglutinin
MLECTGVPIGQQEVRTLLTSKQVVQSPVAKIQYDKDQGLTFFRYVDVGYTIGVDKITGLPTSKLSVLTDQFGNLRTASPGIIKDH